MNRGSSSMTSPDRHENAPQPDSESRGPASVLTLPKHLRVRKAAALSEPRKWLHQQARREWDTRLGTLVKAAVNWRRAFFGCLAVLGLVSAGSISLARAVIAKPKAVPHVIEIDR